MNDTETCRLAEGARSHDARWGRCLEYLTLGLNFMEAVPVVVMHPFIRPELYPLSIIGLFG